MKIVVIGGGAAGPKVAAKSRRMNPANEISMYAEGGVVSYSACGLPYFIAGDVKEIDNLIIRTPEEFEAQGIRVFLNHKCERILPDENAVIVNGEKVHYDELVIATGAKVAPLDIKGIELENIFHVHTIPDGPAVKEKMLTSKRAILVGAGLIGIEMLEAFVRHGLSVTMIEAKEHVLPMFDPEISDLIEKHILDKDGDKITFLKGDTVEEFFGDEGVFRGVKTRSGKTIEADLCVVATGVVPNVEVAQEAGVKIGITGAIEVDERMKTNIPHIWAAGDCTQKTCIVTGRPVYFSLGSIANKEGRVCAINVSGGDEVFGGILCSAVTRYFGYTMSTTGLTEQVAQKCAKGCGFEPIAATVTKADRAGYMPEMNEITVKLTADKKTGKILGAQAIGEGDADKRINVITSAIQSKLDVDDLLHLDLTYAPPFGTAIDPLHEAAYRLKTLIDNSAPA